jgi:hypothetical protein
MDPMGSRTSRHLHIRCIPKYQRFFCFAVQREPSKIVWRCILFIVSNHGDYRFGIIFPSWSKNLENVETDCWFFFFIISLWWRLGYGRLNPASTYTNIIAFIQAFTSLITYSIISATIFIRLMSPTFVSVPRTTELVLFKSLIILNTYSVSFRMRWFSPARP